MKRVLIAIAVLCMAGCDKSEPVAERNTELILRNAELMRDSEKEILDAMVVVQVALKVVREHLNTACDVNGINLNLLKRVSYLETEQSLYGTNWMDNSARLDNLEAGRDPNLMPLLKEHLEIQIALRNDFKALAERVGELETGSYDPNNAIYKFIPLAGADWIEKFGDSDDTRMKHTISELRVVVADMNRRILAIEKTVSDPNEVKK